ncbi:phosphatidate phosphatase LPIN3 [Exaiptasia diaphana]|uniref:phosphatidate phosphatase n=1 Tax=Exaiptasia diaphana TaxID=2652724 RepID=A0A913WWU3_EXADI|nr:phosphatidate phosphatase LPIN3 [Exaiptasia diaphana]KXJ27671.1 Phosphatidate phosphatase LPIN2 [Exaiptasia diaphana]
MNYFKGLVSNVRGFYSEINSATLTGAIDVVVIRQEDGSFSASPFHVRFGKLGVLRSREKIVDILINGEPVDLQMKLGEAGEAFFVEEVEEPSEVPSELSTTPIPPSLSLAATISETKEELINEDIENGCETPTPIEKDEINTSNTSETTFTENPNLENIVIHQESKEDDSNEDKSQPVKQDSNQLLDKDTSKNSQNEHEKQTNEDNSRTITDDTISIDVKETELLQDNQNKEDFSDDLSFDLEQEREDTKDVKIDIPDVDGKARKDSIENSLDNVSQEEDVSHSFSQSIPIPGRQVETYSESHSWIPSSSASLVKEERFKIDHLYPLSDLDSPIGSPPSNSDVETMEPFNPQHCLSDTEAEIQQSQDSMNVISQVTWDWGKLPQGREGVYKHERNSISMKREDGSHGYRSKRKEHKTIKEEGIYLDDLTTIDQEVAALYLNQALSKDVRKAPQSPTTEDMESGIGQSLPSSPTSELANTTNGPETYSNLAISLCGDLKSGKVPLESFINSQVTFEDLSSNPALLSDPKLVIRINDRYYNWQIAAPMLVSYLVFQRPLKQDAVKSLIKQHMPKKEKRRGYYWFSWRQNEEQSSDEDDFEPNKEKFRSRVHSGSRKQLTTTPDPYQDKQTSQQTEQLQTEQPQTEQLQTEQLQSESEVKGQNEGMEEQMSEQELMRSQAQRLRNISECTSGNESDVGYKKTTRLTSEQLAKLKLNDGANSVHFSVTTKYQGTAECQATIYLWNYDDRIVISDIDGTITKSDVLGQILPVVGQAWAQSGVAHFFSSIEKNGYKLLYLSARAIGQAQITRDYLKSVKQDQITLPDGPLLLSPASLIKAFHREVIEKKPEEFKIAALRDILSLFPTTKKPFHSGFGNKINDVYSYRAVGVSLSRIFTINHKGEVRNELTTTFQSSYLDLQNLVDQMFPPYKKEVSMKSSGLVAPDEFSSFTYWRNPLPEVDLEGLDVEEEPDDIPVTFTG